MFYVTLSPHLLNHGADFGLRCTNCCGHSDLSTARYTHVAAGVCVNFINSTIRGHGADRKNGLEKRFYDVHFTGGGVFQAWPMRMMRLSVSRWLSWAFKLQEIQASPVAGMKTVLTHSGVLYVTDDGKRIIQGPMYDVSGAHPVTRDEQTADEPAKCAGKG